MNLPQILYAIRWLIWDTFRQSLASGVFRLLLFFSGIAILVCATITAEGPEEDKSVPGVVERLPPGDPALQGRKSKEGDPPAPEGFLMFGPGFFRVPFPGYRTDAIRHVETVLATAAGDSLGVLLALIFTAGFLPTFLDPAAASVLLTKPVPRWALLVGKYLGVLALVLLQTTVFVGGTWLALALRTGVWHPAYLLCIPVLMLQFAVFFSISVLLAVTTRSTVGSVFGSILFWLICWGMNYGRNLIATVPELQLSGFLRGAAEAAYWVLPKPVDFGLILYKGLKANEFFGHPINWVKLDQAGAFQPELAVLSSLLFGVVILALAGWELSHADY